MSWKRHHRSKRKGQGYTRTERVIREEERREKERKQEEMEIKQLIMSLLRVTRQVPRKKKEEKQPMYGHVMHPTSEQDEEETLTPPTHDMRFLIGSDTPHTYYSTRDYEKFSLIYFNRPVDETKVAGLQKAFREGRNYLRNYPITVNEHFQITDGQHRHAAAWREQVDLFYIIDPSFQMVNAIDANTQNSGWTTKNFMDSYAARQFPEYVTLQNFYLEHTWLKITVMIDMCTRNYKKVSFQNGHFKADRMELAHRVVSMVNSFRPYIGDKQAEYRPFVQTMMNLAQNPNYNHKRMIEKMKQRNSMFKREATVEQYLSMLTDIYNYRVAPENRVLLTEHYFVSRWKRETE